MSLLVEEFSERLDELNDVLTDMTSDQFDSKDDIQTLIESLNAVLSDYGLMPDMEDIDSIFSDWEEPTEFEAINVTIPLYTKENNDTEYSLSITYAQSDESEYIVDLEVQYDWELDEELVTEYLDIDSGNDD